MLARGGSRTPRASNLVLICAVGWALAPPGHPKGRPYMVVVPNPLRAIDFQARQRYSKRLDSFILIVTEEIYVVSDRG
jgi:hypothetical protein